MSTIEKYSEVQDLFSIMTGPMNSKVKPFLRDARISGIRNIINWKPRAGEGNVDGQYGYYYPSWATILNKKPPERCFDTKQESYDWFDNFIALDAQPVWNDLLAGIDYLDSDEYGPVNVTISGNPQLFDGRIERDIPNSIKHVNAFIQAFKNQKPADSRAKFKYFQLANEPEMEPAWAGQFDKNQVEASKSYVRVFNALYDSVRAAHPDIIFVPNCVGHNSAFQLKGNTDPFPERINMNWDTWVGFHIDNISNLEALEYFNVQLYAIPTLRNLAYVSMTQSYADNTRGVRPRYVISETGDPSNFRSQFIYYADNIFVMLQNPDKYARRTGFVASDSGDHAIFKIVDGKVVPQAQYYVYYVLRNLRGTNIHFNINNNNLNTDVVKSFAASPSDKKIVVGLFNPTNQYQTVKVNTGLASEDVSDIIQRKAVWNATTNNADYSENNINVDSCFEVILEPLSVHAVELKLINPLNLNEAVVIKEYYGSKVKQNMDNPLNYTIDIPSVSDSGSQVLLRVGIDERPDLNTDYRISINGNQYTYNLGNLPQKIIDGWVNMSGFIEIPVNTDHLELSNKISLDPLIGFKMLYSSLVLKNLASELNNVSFELYHWEDGNISPLEGATIKLNNYTAVTGLDGKAAISGLIDGQYNYSVQKKGFTPVSDIVSVLSDTIFTDTLEVTDYRVAFTVKDADSGEPVSGAALEFYSSEYTATSTGEVVVEGVLYDIYNVDVEKEGYEPKLFTGIEIFSDTSIILEIHKDYNTVEMKVVSRSTDNPVNRALITAGDLFYLTGPDGNTTADKATEGMFHYRVEADGYFSLEDSLIIHGDTSFTMALTPLRGKIGFSVTDGENPVQGAEVDLGGYVQSTGSDGLSIFYNRPAREDYGYTVNKEGFYTKTDTLYLETDTTVTVTLETITGVSPVSDAGVKIYPNPAKKEVYIETYHIKNEVQIYSANGSLIWSNPLQPGLNSVDIGSFKRGMYLVKVIFGQGVEHQNIIKL